jgi:hypothetical protein
VINILFFMQIVSFETFQAKFSVILANFPPSGISLRLQLHSPKSLRHQLLHFRPLLLDFLPLGLHLAQRRLREHSPAQIHQQARQKRGIRCKNRSLNKNQLTACIILILTTNFGIFARF